MVNDDKTPIAAILQAVTMARRIVSEETTRPRERMLAEALCWYVEQCGVMTRERDSYANSDFERQLSDARAEIAALEVALLEAIAIAAAQGSFHPDEADRIAELRKLARDDA